MEGRCRHCQWHWHWHWHCHWQWEHHWQRYRYYYYYYYYCFQQPAAAQGRVSRELEPVTGIA